MEIIRKSDSKNRPPEKIWILTFESFYIRQEKIILVAILNKGCWSDLRN